MHESQYRANRFRAAATNRRDGSAGEGYRYAMTMTLPTELVVLVWGCILGLIHILAAAQVKTRQYGTKWNMGPRDEELPPLSPLGGRLARAQANFFETFPIFIAAVILALSTRSGLDPASMGGLGAWLWLGGRVAYLPLYALGVPVVRSLAWIVSIAGILLMLWPALRAAV